MEGEGGGGWWRKTNKAAGVFLSRPFDIIEMALRRAFSLGLNFGSTSRHTQPGVLARKSKYVSLSLSRPHFGLQFSQHYQLLFWERGRVVGGGR